MTGKALSTDGGNEKPKQLGSRARERKAQGTIYVRKEKNYMDT